MTITEEVHSRAFARREWLMLIALLLLIEAWVLNLGYSFKSQQDVINYVSFAATIASLLLALIAIIYGYFQSDGQQKSAVAIAGQIDSMRVVQEELNSASGDIGKQISGMTVTATTLQNLTDSLESTHLTLGAIRGDLGSLRGQYLDVIASMERNTVNPAPEAKSALDADGRRTRTEFLKHLFTFGSRNVSLMIVALNALAEKANGEARSWIEFVDRHYIIPLATVEATDQSKIRFLSIGLELIVVFQNLGVVQWTPGVPDESAPSGIKIEAEILGLLGAAAKKHAESPKLKAMADAVLATFSE